MNQSSEKKKTAKKSLKKDRGAGEARWRGANLARQMRPLLPLFILHTHSHLFANYTFAGIAT